MDTIKFQLILKNLGNKYSFDNLALDDFNYLLWFEELNDVLPIPLLEHDEGEVKGETGIKILTPNKSLTRLSVLLAQIKAGNSL